MGKKGELPLCPADTHKKTPVYRGRCMNSEAAAGAAALSTFSTTPLGGEQPPRALATCYLLLASRLWLQKRKGGGLRRGWAGGRVTSKIAARTSLICSASSRPASVHCFTNVW